MKRHIVLFLIPALLAIAAAIALGYYWLGSRRVESETGVVLPVPEPVTDVADQVDEPLYPIAEPETPASDIPDAPPLPLLADSDSEFEIMIADLVGATAVERYITRTGVIGRLVATIDNLPRQDLAERIRPIGGIGSPPVIDETEELDEYVLNSESYGRYDELVQSFVAIDPVQLAATYRRYYPLFQEAYVDLGYPDGYFNDRLIEVIDHLLTTPTVTGPIELVRPHVMYEYADPEIEALSSGQKLLIRMGPDNAASTMMALRDLRTELAGQPPPIPSPVPPPSEAPSDEP